MSQLTDLQKQIAYTLLEKMENDEMTTERATEIARIVEMLLPDSLPDNQLNTVLPDIITIPELSGVGFHLGV